MKDFQEFTKFLEEQIETNPELLPQMQKCYRLNNLSSENLNALLQNYANEVVMVAGQMSLYFLRIYHEWLQGQNE